MAGIGPGHTAGSGTNVKATGESVVVGVDMGPA